MFSTFHQIKAKSTYFITYFINYLNFDKLNNESFDKDTDQNQIVF